MMVTQVGNHVMQGCDPTLCFGDALCFDVQGCGPTLCFGDALCFGVKGCGPTLCFGDALCFGVKGCGPTLRFGDALCFGVQGCGPTLHYGDALKEGLMQCLTPFPKLSAQQQTKHDHLDLCSIWDKCDAAHHLWSGPNHENQQYNPLHTPVTGCGECV